MAGSQILTYAFILHSELNIPTVYSAVHPFRLHHSTRRAPQTTGWSEILLSNSISNRLWACTFDIVPPQYSYFCLRESKTGLAIRLHLFWIKEFHHDHVTGRFFSLSHRPALPWTPGMPMQCFWNFLSVFSSRQHFSRCFYFLAIDRSANKLDFSRAERRVLWKICLCSVCSLLVVRAAQYQPTIMSLA